jgi:hypothetical protein
MPLRCEVLPDRPAAREKCLCALWVAKAAHDPYDPPALAPVAQIEFVTVHGLSPMSKIGLHFEGQDCVRTFGFDVPAAALAIREICALAPHRPCGFVLQPSDIS